MKTFFVLFFSALCGIIHAQIPKTLSVQPFTDFNYPDVEPVYEYDLIYPVNADLLSSDPQIYQPGLESRYFMSVFGPRHKAVNSSNIGFFDYHIGSDITPDVSFSGVSYNDTIPPAIICRCDGEIYEIFDGPNQVLENTGTGRFVTVKCDSSFRANPQWGHMYMAYRHLASVAPGLAEGDPVSMGDTIGIMGESGHTSAVHLHYSLIRRNEGTSRNVHPMRSFDPYEIPHLLSHLTTAEITQLNHWTDSALFRIAVPYNMANFRAIEVSLPNAAYLRTFDFETVSDLPENERDHNDVVDGLELFAYPFNRGHDCHRRVWDAIEDNDMPYHYPGSPDYHEGHFYPFMHEDLIQTPAYVLDLMVKDLPPGYNIQDLRIRIIDIWGYGVEAYGTSQPETEHFAWSMIESEDNDAEEYQNGTMDLESVDLDLVYDGATNGNQHIGLRFLGAAIPPEATITDAFVQFRADDSHAAPAELKVHAEDTGNSNVFTLDPGNISGRDTTFASLTWSPPAWTIDDMDAAQKMTGLAPLVQEVVARNDWTLASPVTFLIRGTGRREAEGFSPTSLWKNAYLYVEYSDTPAPPANEPPVVTLTSPANGAEYFTLEEISLTATASDPNGNLTTVEFYVNGNLAGTDVSEPYETNWAIPGFGNYSIHVVAYDAEGLSTISSISNISVIDQILDVTISNGSDDVEEIQNGTIWKSNADLELGYDNFVSNSEGLVGHLYVGLRFRQVNLPPDAVVTHAYIQFTADETDDEPVVITIRGEYTGDAAPFSYQTNNVSNRTMTSNTIFWAPEAWSTVGSSGPAERTPDISSIIAEIAGHPSWNYGNDMVLILNGDGISTNKRVAESFEGLASGAAKLHIEFSNPENNSQMGAVMSLATMKQPVLQVYPNPASHTNELTASIHIPFERSAKLELYDLFGRRLDIQYIHPGETGSFTFRIDHLSSGTYLVRLSDDDGFTQSEKVFIQDPGSRN